MTWCAQDRLEAFDCDGGGEFVARPFENAGGGLAMVIRQGARGGHRYWH